MSEVIIEDVLQTAVTTQPQQEIVVIENVDVIIGIDATGNVVEIEDDTAEVMVNGGSQVLYFEAPVEVVSISGSDVNGALGAHEELFHYLTDSYTRFVYNSDGMIIQVLTFRDSSEAIRLREVFLTYQAGTLLLKVVTIKYYNATNGTVLLSVTKNIEHDSNFDLKSLTVLRS